MKDFLHTLKETSKQPNMKDTNPFFINLPVVVSSSASSTTATTVDAGNADGASTGDADGASTGDTAGTSTGDAAGAGILGGFMRGLRFN